MRTLPHTAQGCCSRVRWCASQTSRRYSALLGSRALHAAAAATSEPISEPASSGVTPCSRSSALRRQPRALLQTGSSPRQMKGRRSGGLGGRACTPAARRAHKTTQRPLPAPTRAQCQSMRLLRATCSRAFHRAISHVFAALRVTWRRRCVRVGVYVCVHVRVAVRVCVHVRVFVLGGQRAASESARKTMWRDRPCSGREARSSTARTTICSTRSPAPPRRRARRAAAPAEPPTAALNASSH